MCPLPSGLHTEVGVCSQGLIIPSRHLPVTVIPSSSPLPGNHPLSGAGASARCRPFCWEARRGSPWCVPSALSPSVEQSFCSRFTPKQDCARCQLCCPSSLGAEPPPRAEGLLSVTWNGSRVCIQDAFVPSPLSPIPPCLPFC